MIRKLKINIYFNTTKTNKITKVTNKSQSNPPTHNLTHLTNLKLPSKWIPPSYYFNKLHRNMFCSLLKLPYKLKSISNGKSNLNIKQLQAIKDIKHNKDIMVLPADKGGSIVVMETNNYIKEANRQLTDPKYYKPLESSLTQDNYDNISAILKNMLKHKQINNKQFNYLLRPTHTIKDRRFYLLPKIHKPLDKWTDHNTPQGRPIISDVNSESYYTAKLINDLLAPFPPTLESYVKNSYHFKLKISKQNIPINSILVTADINSLYTNMNPDRCIQLTREYLRTLYDESLTNNIIKLLQINLLNNHFVFNKNTYIQTFGIAMGKSFAPHLANIYLAEFDKLAINYKLKPLLFTRYIDDIFFIWTDTMENLCTFQNYLNTLIPDITLNFTNSYNSIDFLDLTVFISNCTLFTKVYFKPTDKHTLLSHNSFHPKHTYKGILKSQFIRYKQLCTLHTHYKEASHTLIQALIPRGYKAKRMKTLSNYIWHKYQPHTKTTDNTIIYNTLTYNNTNIQLAHTISDVIESNSNGNIKITTAWRSNLNLKRLTRNIP